MSRTVSVENLLSSFPYSLSVGKNQNELAETTAKELLNLWKDNDLLAIYTRILELDEPLLDILAHDFKVDWYLYDGSLESKRHQIYSLFYVHRHLGTRRATERALSDICPGTFLEEWYEYGGKPYYFRVVIDVTEQRMAVSQSLMEYLIEIFKPVRSRLDGGHITLRSRCTILVSCVGNYAYITDRICGTYPKRAMQGRISENVILVSETGTAAGFTAPPAGSIVTGTYPRPAMQGRIEEEVIYVSEEGTANVFRSPPAGSIKAGTYPYMKWRGAMSGEEIIVEVEDGEAGMTARKTGTYPRTAMQGRIHSDSVEVISEGDEAALTAPRTGTIPRTAQQGNISRETVEVIPVGSEAGLSAPKTGTVPQAAVKGGSGSGNIEASASTESANVIAHKAGSPPDVAASVDAGDGNISFDSDGGSAKYIARPCGKPFGLF